MGYVHPDTYYCSTQLHKRGENKHCPNDIATNKENMFTCQYNWNNYKAIFVDGDTRNSTRDCMVKNIYFPTRIN